MDGANRQRSKDNSENLLIICIVVALGLLFGTLLGGCGKWEQKIQKYVLVDCTDTVREGKVMGYNYTALQINCVQCKSTYFYIVRSGAKGDTLSVKKPL